MMEKMAGDAKLVKCFMENNYRKVFLCKIHVHVTSSNRVISSPKDVARSADVGRPDNGVRSFAETLSSAILVWRVTLALSRSFAWLRPSSSSLPPFPSFLLAEVIAAVPSPFPRVLKEASSSALQRGFDTETSQIRYRKRDDNAVA